MRMTVVSTSDTLAIVTGAAKGNGKSIADALEGCGAKVVRVDQLPSEEGIGFVGSVTDDDLIKEVIDYCEKQSIAELLLINNAGITYPSEFPYPGDLWDKTLDVNLSAPFKWIEALIPLYKKVKRGAIINITSLGAERAFPNNPSYITAKGGLKMLTKYYAKFLGEYGICVNNVGPGYIKTDMTRNSYENMEIRKSRAAHTFLGRWGESEDIANVCLFLCSDESRYITGQDIYVDGGWLSNGLVEK